MNQLNKNGFLILSVDNQYKNQFHETMLDFYEKNTYVNYNKVKLFIDNQYIPYIQQQLNIVTPFHYRKFRFSNNNNSSDASTFHGDVYNYTDKRIVPIYTCLYYFDDTKFEIIPGTHDKERYKNLNFYDVYNKRKRIHISSGSIVIIHASLHHRGVSFNKANNRRLLQVFDININNEDYNIYKEKLITINTKESYLIKSLNNFLTYIFKIYSNEMLSLFHYFLVYYKLQYKIFNSPNKKDKDKLLTYEPGKHCDFENSNQIKTTNINIICNKDYIIKSPDYSFLYIYIIYWILSFIIIYFIIKYKKYIKSYILKNKSIIKLKKNILSFSY